MVGYMHLVLMEYYYIEMASLSIKKPIKEKNEACNSRL